MNAKYNELNTTDVATMLGVHKATVIYWCKMGYLKPQDISDSGSSRPRFVFDVDEINRVSKLRDQYGKHWVDHVDIQAQVPVAQSAEVTVYGVTKPEDYIPDDTDEITGYVKKIRAMKIQRDKLLAELDSIDEAIKTMRQKVIDAI